MVAGDSFVVPVPKGQKASVALKYMSSCAATWRKRNRTELKFAARVLDEGRAVGVWAVAK